MIKLKINHQEIQVAPGTTILKACQELGTEIPVFCYHEKLKVVGNCRMCLVEVKGASKPVASCAMPAADGMEVFTESPLVQDCRKGNLEFLLINHPLDCPICDEAGECDLQDITLAYGPDTSRYKENKRAVPDKNFGPLIKTVMNRCIHCARCVRFTEEIAGSHDIIGIGRGEDTEITTFLENAVQSELAGNLVDICPVGALTSKPYAFKARPWELTRTLSVDVMDGVGSHIHIDSVKGTILRILPAPNDDINETWITDKARHAFDGLKLQRLDNPYVRKNGHLTKVTWDEALKTVATKLQSVNPRQVAAIAGDLADVETMFLLKELLQGMGIQQLDCRSPGTYVETHHRSDYLFNTPLAALENADACLIIGSNIRWEAPLVNTRLRKAYLRQNLKVGYIGPLVDLTYPIEHLGEKPNVLNQFWRGTHPFLKVMQAAKYPVVILGEGALKGDNGARVYTLAKALAEREGWIGDTWNGFNVLHQGANRVGGLDTGFILPSTPDGGHPQVLPNGDSKVVYLLNADELDMATLGDAYVIYQGHHGDKGAERADIILPGSAYTEKSATYTNIEGRVQETHQVTPPLGDAKEDWRIIRKLSEYLERPLPYDTREQVLEKLGQQYPSYKYFGQLVVDNESMGSTTRKTEKVKDILVDSIQLPIQNYYMTNPISRSSVIMAQCSKAVLSKGGRHD